MFFYRKLNVEKLSQFTEKNLNPYVGKSHWDALKLNTVYILI